MSITQQITRIQNEVSSQTEHIDNIVTHTDGKTNPQIILNQLIHGGNEELNIDNPYIGQVAQYAFYHHPSLKTFKADNATVVEDNAFDNCQTLQKVDMPSLYVIKDSAFYNCSNLSELNAPKLIWIKDHGLNNCNLSQLDLSQACFIDSYALANNNFITIDLSNVQELGTYVLINNNNLTSVILPITLTTLPAGCFQGCSSLKELDLSNIENIHTYALSGTGIQNIYGEKITSLNNYCFSQCSNIQNIYLPLITYIPSYSFQYTNGSYVFTDNEFPKLTSLGSYAAQYANGLKRIDLSKVTSIPSNCFTSCGNLQSVNLPNTTLVNSYAFSSCNNLTTVNIPKLQTIGNNAFQYCDNLTSAKYPKVTSIGTYAFYDCDGLTEINFPKLTSSIGTYAFNSCNSLEKVVLGGTLSSIGNYAFRYCTNLKTIYITKTSSIISLGGSYVFSNSGVSNGNALIYVPNDLVDTYKAASYWSTYANYIVGYEVESMESVSAQRIPIGTNATIQIPLTNYSNISVVVTSDSSNVVVSSYSATTSAITINLQGASIGKANITVKATGLFESEQIFTVTVYDPDAPTGSYTVTNVGSNYGFYLNSEGYYVNENSDADGDELYNDSWALCEVLITNPGGQNVSVNYIQSSESNYDYAIFSDVNTELYDGDYGSSGEYSEAENVYDSSYGVDGSGVVDYGVLATGDTFQVKYRKDSSAMDGTDTIQFKVIFE